MRIMELCVVGVLVLASMALWCFRFGSRRLEAAQALAVAAALLSHLVMEGARWQMVPAYIPGVLLILFPTGSPNSRPGRFLRAWKPGLVFLGVVGGLMSGFLSSVLPVPLLPPPTGPFAVGMDRLLLEDPDRRDPFLGGESGGRSIAVALWYPAMDGCLSEEHPYWPRPVEMSRAWAEGTGRPWARFLWTHLALVKLRHCPSGEPGFEGGKFPVVIFSHGYGQYSGFNSSLHQELASHGFVVIALSHPHETPFALLPDGSVPVSYTHLQPTRP